MKQARTYKLVLFALSASVSAFGATLFSDLGPGGTYDSLDAYVACGSGVCNGNSFAAAALFAVTGSGSQAVSQIDIVAYDLAAPPPETLTASIWTDSSGIPGTELTGASWNFVPPTTQNGLVSITGISGLSLTGGSQYFLVVVPGSLSGNAYLEWWANNQGSTGLMLYSENGGSWISEPFAEAAFDVQGTPEPAPCVLLAAGLAIILARRKVGTREEHFRLF